MSNKLQKATERKLQKAEKMIIALEDKLKREKEGHKVTKEKNKSLTNKLSRRNQSSQNLKVELSVLKKTFDTKYPPPTDRQA